MDEWNLNSAQQRAFQLVADRSLTHEPDPLRMYISGPAGTGKSQVINCLRAFFERRNQSRRLRVCWFMGIAARNVSGMTLHAALSINGRKKLLGQSHSDADLMAMWEGVDFLFIDEVSMISCGFLSQISKALLKAKGNILAFGGINVIFAGDFAQLPPVADQRLYGKLDTKVRASTERGQDMVFGKVLWQSVSRVVNLTVQYRQAGQENAEFVSLLQRLRVGRCTQSDFETLNSRVLENCHPNLKSQEWLNAPIIVKDNAAKDALNEHCAIRFAQDNKRDLHWYYPVDKYKNSEITDATLVDHLRSLNSNHTNQRLGCLPLVLGMPVLVAQNFDVEGGIVNGSRGTVKKICYYIDGKGDRHLRSCVVHIPNSSSEAMPNLSANDLPILRDSRAMSFRHPHTGRSCTMQRAQVPIVPAFTMTAHRAQGQTLPNVIVDLQSCTGMESPYVMISRVKSLAGLLILRPFNIKKITCRQSQDMRRENDRLHILDLKTTVLAGTTTESRVAAASLTLLGILIPTGFSQAIPYADRNYNQLELLKHLQNEKIPSQINNSDALSNRRHIMRQVLTPLHDVEESVCFEVPTASSDSSTPIPVGGCSTVGGAFYLLFHDGLYSLTSSLGIIKIANAPIIPEHESHVLHRVSRLRTVALGSSAASIEATAPSLQSFALGQPASASVDTPNQTSWGKQFPAPGYYSCLY